uniref:U1 small nuclear ribonucleoprotein C n=1 Tax=Bionectria ochroleuca TaxID=29856 RepID=A0A8H7TS29_BIOOC
MPKFFCDYCDVYLTHDSMSVRRAHNSGRNHLRNVVDYYQQIGHEKAQSVIDSITSSYAAEGQAHANPMLPHNQPGHNFPPFPFPGGAPPPFPGMPGAPPGQLPQGLPPPPGGRGGPMPLPSRPQQHASHPSRRPAFPPRPVPPFPPPGQAGQGGVPPPFPGLPGMPPPGAPGFPPGGIPRLASLTGTRLVIMTGGDFDCNDSAAWRQRENVVYRMMRWIFTLLWNRPGLTHGVYGI